MTTVREFLATALLSLMFLASTGVSNAQTKPSNTDSKPDAAWAAVAISEPGFEDDGAWRFGQTGSGTNGFFGQAHEKYIKAGFIDPLPQRGTMFAYNNGPQHDLYQVLEATIEASTTYKLSIIAIASTFANPFPGGELRLGYVPGKDDGMTGDKVANDYYGEHLLKPIRVNDPVPVNAAASDDGYETWTWTFTTPAKPMGLGQKMRIEILGGGEVQSLFDNVRLQSRPATPSEIERAVRGIDTVKVTPVVVMLGDSTTDGGMPRFVEKQLKKLIASPGNLPKLINAGKGGDNATSALQRLEKDVVAHHPDIVTVSFGLNDTGGRQPNQFRESLKKIVRILEDAEIQVVLITSTPFNNDRHGWGKRKEFQELGGLDEYMDREFCEKMRSLSASNDIPLCDLHAVFKDRFKDDVGSIEKLISSDGVHLTAEGYVLAAENIAPILRGLLKAKLLED